MNMQPGLAVSSTNMCNAFFTFAKEPSPSSSQQGPHIMRFYNYTGDLIPGVNTPPTQIMAAFTLLKNRDKNSQKAEIAKNMKN